MILKKEVVTIEEVKLEVGDIVLNKSGKRFMFIEVGGSEFFLCQDFSSGSCYPTMNAYGTVNPLEIDRVYRIKQSSLKGHKNTLFVDRLNELELIYKGEK